ncbi:enolase 4 isoform X1 [Canis lupus familiaris]|uniref:Enolase 4 n=2 Tax=Canis lupus familiaris TaxID=9615 RepID=A0A8C0TT02_CANLF|nr:enolase 4 isoform X1 [Canis lupus familiaris]XP_038434833.1 enolase 4 isoform X1 [Canis lupus familiaris]XP_535025.3 enolase 4 isoform X1 [Canis lupus familiaris]|eukprot:XP_535025.3 enolase 4 isoform X1 [Canis lupus familiaris]
MGEEGGGRSFGTARELQKLKQQAMEYYRENDVPRRLEELLNSTFYLQPADVYGHLANCFAKLAKPPTICKVVGKNVLDGLGLPTLQVEIFCTIQNFPKNVCSVVISTHFEVHENISPELAEAEQVERLAAVSTAVQWVNGTITEELWGMVPSHQAEVDQVLRTFFENKVQEDKERRELEKSLEDPTAPIPLPLPPPPPPPQPPAKKKGQKQGRNDTVTEKPILPPEPAEPVLSGSMAIGAVSLAVAKTSAILGNNPLYLNIALLKQQEQPAKLTVPLLMVSLVSCGKASPGKLNLMKELMCIPHPGLTAKQGVEMLLEIQKHINKTIEMTPPPKTETRKGHNGSKRGQQPITGKMSHLGCLTINYDTIEQPLLLIQGICANLGLDMGTNLHLAINCAAHELMDYNKGKYEVMTGIHKNTAEMLDLYVDLINKFPSIIALIDPFRKEDSEQWESIYNTLGSRCYIIAGAASKSISQLLEGGNNSTPKSSGVIIKHTNQTTVSDLVEVTNLLDSKQHITVFGSTEGESSDDSLVDLAIGLGVRFIKLGGLSRGERVTKYNRLFTIEEELVQNGTLGCNEGHTFFSLNDEVETGTKASKAVAPVTGELPELPEPVFPTELMEASANA